MSALARCNGAVSYWQASLPVPVEGRRPPLTGELDADVCIVGAGYTGLWTAYHLKRARPSLEVVVLEREHAGFGASGRNGGWLTPAFAGGFGGAMERAMRESVEDVLSVCGAEGIEADIVRGGVLRVACNEAQARRLRAQAAREADLAWLDADAVAQRVRVAGVVGGTWTPHGVRVQPAKLVRGLAAAAERLGVRIHEGTSVREIAPGRAVATRGIVHAPVVIACVEGFTASLRGERRRLLPLTSAMVVTAPLPDVVWAQIGWDGAELLGDGAHAFIYAQRTADGRIALGGRGAYRFGSRTDRRGRVERRTVAWLVRRLAELFPAAADVPIDHAWCGVIGVARDWTPAARYDRRSGLGTAGGYVGNGVGAAHLAGRTLRDLVLGEQTELTRLPWVGYAARRWEPEPLRKLGATGVAALYRTADRREGRGLPHTSRLALAADRIAGRRFPETD